MDIDISTCTLWKNSIYEASKQLESLNASTEEEFLLIGEQLQHIYKTIEDIKGIESSLISLITGKDIQVLIIDLKDLIEKIGYNTSSINKDFLNSKEILKDIVAFIDNIYKPINNFKKVIKTLRILSISTKIESSKLSSQNSGFLNIADDVEKLALLIGSKFMDIISYAESLKKVASKTMGDIDNLERQTKGKKERITEDIHQAILSINEKNNQSLAGAQRISGELISISDNIGELVSSIQFHDITRQQIGHVVEALQGLCKAINNVSANNEEPSVMKDLLEEIYVVCGLQIEQLYDAEKKFTGAIENILNNLDGLSGNTLKLHEEIKNIAGLRNTDTTSFFSNLESGICYISSSITENNSLMDSLKLYLDEVFSTLNNMTRFVSDIEDINENIELIALNARIKSAHTGSEGAPLGVIAEAIQRLSIEARNKKTEISGQLQNVKSQISNMDRVIGGDINELLKKTEDMCLDLNNLTKGLRNSNEEIILFLKKIEDNVHSLVEIIDSTLKKIEVHHRFALEIKKVLSVLNSVISHIQRLLPDNEIQGYLSKLHQLTERYTMESERIIHKKYLNNGEVIDEAGPLASDNEMGDNVELF